jgi:alcohol dehydrogenase (cytochrome c)
LSAWRRRTRRERIPRCLRSEDRTTTLAVQHHPQPGDPNFGTWNGDSWKTGGASTWNTGAYDPETNTLFWGTSNPWPDYFDDMRAGDNLYSCSVLALDPDTGRLKWFYQFTPHVHA